MRILVAEDDAVSRKVMETLLVKWGYDVLVSCDGAEAWQILQGEDIPELALLDWMMPEMDGIEVCQRFREKPNSNLTHIILLTAKGRKEDIITGLEAGADDYLTKPFDRGELHARIRVGEKILELQKSLASRVKELEEALSQVKQLQGFLPICCYCKKIRDDQNYWQQLESYITRHSEVQFSHGICPECYEKVVKPRLAKLREKRMEKKPISS